MLIILIFCMREVFQKIQMIINTKQIQQIIDNIKKFELYKAKFQKYSIIKKNQLNDKGKFILIDYKRNNYKEKYQDIYKFL